MGYSNLLDFQLAMKAEIVLMMARRSDSAYMSEYSWQIDGSRSRHNKSTTKVFCF